MKILLNFLLILAHEVWNTQATLHDSVEEGNYVFKSFTEKGIYEDAETFCSNDGGWIAEPVNADFNNALAGIVEPGETYWIGLRRDNSMVWQWQQDRSVVGTKSGSTCTEGYCNWIGGDGDDPGETYAAIDANLDAWIDADNINQRKFACQYVTPAQDSVEVEGYVFKTFVAEGLYEDAEIFCRNDGGWIAEPTNRELNNALTGILPSGYYWIGLRRDAGMVWQWQRAGNVVGVKDGSTCSDGYCNWNGGDGDNPGETYAMILYSGSWADVNLSNQRKFACQYVIPPQGIVEEGNYVFKSFVAEGLYEDAERLCRDDGGWIAEPVNAELNSALTGILEPSENYWIGIRRDSMTWQWQQDGTVVGTKNGITCTEGFCNWYGGEGDDPGDSYAAILYSGLWIDSNNNNQRKYACQYVISAQASVKKGSYLFKSFEIEGLYGDAETFCRNDNGWVAEPVNSDINDALAGILPSQNYWIGLRRDDSMVWQWQQDGRAVGTKDGSTCSEGYCNWSGDDGDDPGETYAAILPLGSWIDVNLYYQRKIACQYGCYDNRCQHGGTCTFSSTDYPYYSCACANEFEGDNCEDCKSDTCQHGGICHGITSYPYYSCSCEVEFDGNQCQNCKADTCQHGGTCHVTASSPYYSCTCRDEFYGDKCQNCKSDTCRNGGTCQGTTSYPYYHCACKDEFDGNNCQNCKSNACQHGGTCQIIATSPYYSCTCSEEFDGNKCQNCKSNTCQHGGTCQFISDDPYYSCICRDEFEGYKCQDCKSDTCQNGGTCILSDTGPDYFTCNCTDGYYGMNCERGAMPTIQSATGIACSVEGKISIVWSPDKGFEDEMHKIRANPVSSGGRSNEACISPTGGTTQTTIEGLTSSTVYTVKITPCPTVCIDDLSATTTAKTGVGLPGAVQGAKVEQQEENAECKVTWSFPVNVSDDDIIKFEVKSTEKFIYQSSTDGLTTITRYFYVNNSNLQHITQPEPNRRYTFELKAETCAGYGNSLQAVGECVGGYAAPYTVPAPTSVDEIPASTRQLEIAIPNENNGPITCIFVVVMSGSKGTSEEFNINDLQRVSRAATEDNPPGDSEYLALAIPKSDIAQESIFVTLGDQNVTKCAVEETYDDYYEARNWELIIGKSYSVYIATSTPVSQGLTDFQTSDAVLIDNGTSDSDDSDLWIIGAVLGPLVIIAIVGAAFVYRRRGKGNLNQSSADRAYETPYQFSDLKDRPSKYDNVTVNKDDDADQHVYSTIPDLPVRIPRARVQEHET